MSRALSVSLLVVAAAACGKGSAASNGKPCDAAAVEALSADLAKANCENVDLQNKALTDACEATKKQLTGKKYAFKGCTFGSQGNDEVSFSATGSDKRLECAMKGGEAGVKSFRQAAMKLDMKKLRLDVSGVLQVAGDKPFERLQLTDCSISAHE